MDNVAAATVYGEPNAITGRIVCARVTPLRPEEPRAFGARVKAFCRQRLEPYKVPVKVTVVDDPQYGSRFKKTREVGA